VKQPKECHLVTTTGGVNTTEEIGTETVTVAQGLATATGLLTGATEGAGQEAHGEAALIEAGAGQVIDENMLMLGMTGETETKIIETIGEEMIEIGTEENRIATTGVMQGVQNATGGSLLEEI